LPEKDSCSGMICVIFQILVLHLIYLGLVMTETQTCMNAILNIGLG